MVPLPLSFRPDFVTAGLGSPGAVAVSCSVASAIPSGTGMSRRSRKRFSGTGGISSGRTTGFSLFTFCSLAPSSSSAISCSAGLPSFLIVSHRFSFLLTSFLRLFGRFLLKAFFLFRAAYFLSDSCPDSNEVCDSEEFADSSSE